MVEEILSNLYRIEIPLPNNPLKSLNSYLIKGDGRFLLIDTGMNREECLQAMTSGLETLAVNLSKTDFFITHLHADHLGLAATLATDASTVYFNRKDAAIVNTDPAEKAKSWQRKEELFYIHGFPKDDLQNVSENHPGRRFSIKNPISFHFVKEGDTIEIGDYSFQCIETPGHSPGHTCLYEANKKILLSGDHILFDITPNIMFWYELDNALKQYLTNLEKIYPLEVNLVLPGHRRLMNNHRKRIRELQEHHQARLNEVLSALKDGAKSVFQIVPYISWDINCKSWEEFPPAQKWFAFGEALTHLQYLKEAGTVREEMKGDKILYSVS